ncbi:MAG: restriction endonuclease [Ruminococcus sp.]|nr:restriction endonuclease [Ruminococcus sp.]
MDTKALRSRILDLAIQGKLTEQLESDGTAEELYQQIQAEKLALIKEGKIKKEKPLPEISANEIPFEIPSNWKWVRFSNVCVIINGDRGKNYPAKSSLKKEGIPFISALNLNGKSVEVDDNLLCLSDEQYERLGNGKLMKDDIAICIRGSLGKHGRYPFEKGAIASSLVITRFFTEKETLGNYEMLWLDSTMFPLEIKKYDSGTAQPNLAAENLSKFLYPLPPLAEQKRIVERVEEIFSLLDTIDKAQEKYSADSQILKAKLITAGIQGKLTKQLESDGTAEELYQQIQVEKQKLIKEGKLKKEKPLPPISTDEIPFEIPQNWMWVRLGEIMWNRDSERIPVSVADRKKLKKVYDYYGASGVIDKVEEYLFDKRLLLIGEDGANLLSRSTPIAFMADGKYWVNNHAHVLDCYIENYLDFVMYYINAISLVPYVTGSAQPKLNQDRMNKIPIPLPPLAEQKRIAAVLEKLLGTLE